MDETGSMSELERRLRTKAEADRKRSEQIYLDELKMLGANLRRRVRQEADSIVSAMESLTRPVRGTLRRLTLLYIALGVLLSLGIFGGNWALVQWQSRQIESLREESAQLEAEIAGQRLTLQRLQDQTWGVRLVENKQGRFVVLPKGTLSNPPWVWPGEFPAVLLSRK